MSTRVTSLHGLLSKLRVDALLFNTSEVLPSTNLRYFTGFTGSDASMLVTSTERRLFTDGRYRTQAREQAREFQVHVVRNKVVALAGFLKASNIKRLGIETSRVSHEFVTQLSRRVPQMVIVPLKRDFLERVRIRKDPEEKAKIKKAASLASQACRDVLADGLRARKESEVAAELEYRFRSLGADGIAFETIVASGERSALPHGTAGEKVIGRGELVILDYGCRLDGYCSDETVTCVTSSPSPDQKKMYQAVHDAHMRALEAVREGIGVRELDRIARAAIEEAGLGKYFVHGLGHGVGLEVHEPPYLSGRGRGVLQEGMVFTIEPGVYIEGVGGVRLESLVYLSPTGPEVLCEMPKDLISVA